MGCAVDSRIGVGKVCTGRCYLQRVIDFAARAEVVAGGPSERDGFAGMGGLAERVGSLIDGEGEHVAPLVQFGIVVVGAGSQSHYAE